MGVVLALLGVIDGALVALWYYTRIEVAIAVAIPQPTSLFPVDISTGKPVECST